MKYGFSDEGDKLAAAILRAPIGRATKALVALAVLFYEELNDSAKQERVVKRIQEIIDETNKDYEPPAS